MESRAIFVVDSNNTIQHAEYVKEVADHPDYEAALRRRRNSPAARVGVRTGASAE